jgi:hypothetical protein
MFSKHFLLAASAVGAALLLNATAQAVTIDQLTGTSGSTIVAGDLVYSNFTYGGTTPASDVVVTSTASGLEFSTSTGGWTTPTGSSVIAYDISVTGNSVQTVNLGFTATATGDAVASVGETVTDLTTNTNYELQVATSGIAGFANSDTDSVTLNPTSDSLHIIKSIDVASMGAGTATITLVDNTYTQAGGSPPPVPEPMTLALLPLALAGLGLRKKFAR